MPTPVTLVAITTPIATSPPTWAPLDRMDPISSLAVVPPHLLASGPSMMFLVDKFNRIPVSVVARSTLVMGSLSLATANLTLPSSSNSSDSVFSRAVPLARPFSSPRVLAKLIGDLGLVPSSLTYSASSGQTNDSFSMHQWAVMASLPEHFTIHTTSVTALPPPAAAIYFTLGVNMSLPSVCTFVELFQIGGSLTRWAPLDSSPSVPVGHKDPTPLPVGATLGPLSGDSRAIVILPAAALISGFAPDTLDRSASF